MATFTEYQLRRYRFIFSQHAEDALIEHEKQQSNHATPHILTPARSALAMDTGAGGPGTSSMGGGGPQFVSGPQQSLGTATPLLSGNSGGQQLLGGSSLVSRVTQALDRGRLNGSSVTRRHSSHEQVELKEEEEERREMQVKSTYRLTVKELQALMPRFGPPLSHEVARSIMLRYDSSCTGSLDFEDFIEFLADYKVTLDVKRDAARRLYAMRPSLMASSQNGGTSSTAVATTTQPHQIRDLVHSLGFNVDQSTNQSFILAALRRAATEIEFLTFLNLDDPESLWTSADSMVKAMSESGMVTDLSILQRYIAVRVVEARGLGGLTRTKLRPGRGIEYASLDPFVRVTVAGKSKQTSALLSTVSPMWDQELLFPVTIPPGEVHDVVHWVQSHEIVLEILDLHNSGTLSHGEVLARGTISLMRVLMTVKKPFELSVVMRSVEGGARVCAGSGCETPSHQQTSGSAPKRIVLHVHATDQTQERGSFAKVLDVCMKTEHVWRRKYPEKMKRDLVGVEKPVPKNRKPPSLNALDNGNDEEDDDDADMQEYFKSMEQQSSVSNFWNYYSSIIDSTHHLFPRRNYAVLALDECNTFRTLSSFLCPIRLGGKYTRHDIANYVARIPFYSSWTAFSDATHRQLSKLASSIANKLHHSTQPLSDAFLHPVVCAESRFTQVATPGSLVSRGFGSILDHAILLCSLFLGAGHDAYVAIGTTYGKHTVWVITIDKRDHCPPFVLCDEVDGAHDTSGATANNHYGVFRGGSSPFDPHSFLQRSKFDTVQRVNSQLVVQHWDPVQGKSWTSWKEHNFPYERVACLVNHTNVWFNVQPSDCLTRAMFSWEVGASGAGAWLPFVASGGGEFRDIMQCFYATPTILHDVTLTFTPDDANLLRQVMQLIRSYRKNHLLMTTQFHRGLSKWQHQVIPQLEKLDSEQLRASRTRGPSGTQSAHVCFGGKSAGGGPFGAAQNGDIQCLQDPGENVPPQTVYVHRFLQFHGRVSAIAMLHHLVALGLVDCSVPGCAFSIALGSVVYPLGAHRVWLGIGELTPIG